jgi:hypothetical protein
MKPLRHLGSVLAAALWLTVTGQSVAQFPDEQSQYRSRPDDVRPLIDRPEDALRRRLHLGRDLSDTEKLVQQIFNNLSDKDKEDILKSVKDNPELRASVTQALLNQPELRELARKSGPRNVPNEVKDWLRKQIPDVRPPDNQPNIPNPMGKEPIAPPPLPDAGSGPGGSDDARSRTPEAKKGDPTGLKKLLIKAGPKAADVLAGLGLKDDAEYLRGLIRGKLPAGNDGYLARAVGRAAKVARELPLDKLAAGDFAGVFENLHVPRVPKFNLAIGGSRSDGGSGYSIPLLPGEGVGAAIAWVVIGIVFLVFLWKGKELFLPSDAGTERPWKLGPWPVRPEQVRTRADLVKAFEYLAFLVLGLAARPLNHLSLASDLAATGDMPARRDAADRLARLYERARYAPEEEALPVDDLRTASHDLTFLAGVGPA